MFSFDTFTFDNGGHRACYTRNCAARSMAIVTGLSYEHIRQLIMEEAKNEKIGKKRKSTPSGGVRTSTVRKIMTGLGWTWHPTMGIGTGCKVHLRADELPSGRLMVRLSRHYAAVIDGVVHDLSDPSRNGTRCVYGYWAKSNSLLGHEFGKSTFQVQIR